MLSHSDLIELQPTLSQIVGNDEDALQDTCLRLLKFADVIRDPARYAPRAAKRCRIDAARGQTRRVKSLSADSQ